ncbi:MAG: class I SAM-dependent methyltransferase [Blastochloris sp.]|nr:class I SAM-dependent methyltransferase [Blastochloris sp.]
MKSTSSGINSGAASMKYGSGLAYLFRHPSKALWKLFKRMLGQVSPLHRPENFVLPSDFNTILQDNSEDEHNAACDNMYHYGGSLQRQRLVALAEWSAQHYSGDFVEIGAFCGDTSKLLAELAAKHQRRLIVIDPWITGSQDCDGAEFAAFQNNIAAVRDHVDVWQASSLDEEIIQRLKKREVSFAFVDGLHTLKACLSDILSVGHTKGVIAIDDTRYNHDLLFSIQHAANQLNHYAVQDPEFRESFLLPKKDFSLKKT